MTQPIFVLAPDSFKESMTAEQACHAMQRGIQQIFPQATCIHVPMADGGEGTVDALIHALSGQKIFCEVQGPLPHQKIQTYFGLVDGGQTAIMEMAKANGIDLLKKRRAKSATDKHVWYRANDSRCFRFGCEKNYHWFGR